jgi:Alanine racemase
MLGGRKLISVVKANAYGHGAVQVAKRLEADGCASFAVATIDEAIALRESGILSETVILGYTPPRFLTEIIAYNLTQVVFDGDYAKELNREAEKLNRAMSAYLKIDCGMGRLGIPLRSKTLFDTLSEVKKCEEYS